MRAKRRHAAVFALLVSVSAMAAFFSTSNGLFGFDRNLSIPGELTAAHAHLIDGDRCGLCHEAHDRQGMTLINALVEYQDLSANCIECHAFDGHARRPHNAVLSKGDGTETLGCIGCHTEHQGAEANIAPLPDRDCHQCHEAKTVFDDFGGTWGKPHPPFKLDYGSPAASVINFDHAKHFDTHFKKPEHRDQRPETCQDCHQAGMNGDDIAVPSFEEGCATCHEEQIRDQPLLLLVWPEMERMTPPSAEVADACRTVTSWDAETFESASYELPGLIESFLMDIDPDDMSSYGDAYQQLARSLALDGVQPLAEIIEAKGGDANRLLAGLSPETVARPACDWLSNEEYEGFTLRDGQGWTAEPLGISYRPTGHADPTIKAWLDYGLELDAETGGAIVEDLKHELFDDEAGPGNCVRCHHVEDGSGARWRSPLVRGQHTIFRHQPHLVLAEAADRDSCGDCHQLKKTVSKGADFQGIGIETCQQCHGNDGVSASCRHCHRYHPVR